MGKGDKKSRRGKIILGTYGARRRKKKVDKVAVKSQDEKAVNRIKAQPEVKETKAPVVKEHRLKAEKPEKSEKAEKPEKSGKSEKPVKQEKSEKDSKAKEPKPKKEKKE
ncbi:MAG TPA: 30S ribosomal protein THX [Bacteroidales bacterium]|nr:30S ribosomal protein THX [Bacteroidales bacterium]